MTRTGALVWKEWRDHRVTLAVFAALVPLVSWPVQRWVFKFAEPEWTWRWILPISVGLSGAAIAADLFANDLATDRMNASLALPVPLSRHFGTRTAFLAVVAVLFAAWTMAVNAAIVGLWGKPGSAAALLGAADLATTDLARCAATAAAVTLLSALGIGGFRAVIGGVVIASVACIAADFAADRLFPLPPYNSAPGSRTLLTLLASTAVLSVAAWAAFRASHGHAALRKRGALWAAGIVVLAFGAPAAGAAWKMWRGWTISPHDPDFRLMDSRVSPDGRFVGVVGGSDSPMAGRGCRSWIVSVDDGRTFDWPRRKDYVAGWTSDGLVWVGRWDQSDFTSDQTKRSDYGVLARPETGEVVERITDTTTLGARIVSGWRAEPSWAQWMRYDWQPARKSSKGVPPTYAWRLWVVDGNLERKIEARAVCPTPTVGRALIVTPDSKLALVDLAGGEPRVVADDATALQFWLTGSPDGRRYVVGTSKGPVVLDGTTWQRVAGPFADAGVTWCCATGSRSVVAVMGNQSGALARLVDVDSGREIPIDASLGVLGGYGSIQPLDDGRLVARTGTRSILLLGADGKLIRRLFPPEE